jgi:hypothetical protein
MATIMHRGIDSNGGLAAETKRMVPARILFDTAGHMCEDEERRRLRAAAGLVALMMTGLIVDYVFERLRYFILVRSKAWLTIRLDLCCFSG